MKYSERTQEDILTYRIANTKRAIEGTIKEMQSGRLNSYQLEAHQAQLNSYQKNLDGLLYKLSHL